MLNVRLQILFLLLCSLELDRSIGMRARRPCASCMLRYITLSPRPLASLLHGFTALHCATHTT